MKISTVFERIAFATLLVSSPLGFLHAQSAITLNSLNVQLKASSFTLYTMKIAGVQNPTEGQNQTWNYSSAQLGATFAEQLAAANDSHFSPSALFDTLGFDPITSAGGTVYGINFNDVYDQGSAGITNPGVILTQQAYNIDAATGNTKTKDDSLWVTQQTDLYTNVTGTANPEGYLTLPATMGTNWSTTNAKRTIDMQVRIAELSAYYPGITDFKKESAFTTADSVVGWGTLMLPGSASSKNALLIKVTENRVDSFYLNNAVPSIQLILEGFGLAEGMVTTTTSWRFMVQGQVLPALQIIDSSNNSNPATMWQYSEASSSVAFTEQEQNGIHIYPNPSRGRAFFLQFDTPVSPADHITVVDASGKIVPTDMGSLQMNGTLTQVSLAPEAAAGTYFIRVERANGTVGQSKIVVTQ